MDEEIDPSVEDFFLRWERNELKFPDIILYTDLVNSFKTQYPNASVAKFRRGLTIAANQNRIVKHTRHPHKGEGKQTYSLFGYKGPTYFPSSVASSPKSYNDRKHNDLHINSNLNLVAATSLYHLHEVAKEQDGHLFDFMREPPPPTSSRLPPQRSFSENALENIKRKSPSTIDFLVNSVNENPEPDKLPYTMDEGFTKKQKVSAKEQELLYIIKSLQNQLEESKREQNYLREKLSMFTNQHHHQQNGFSYPTLPRIQDSYK